MRYPSLDGITWNPTATSFISGSHLAHGHGRLFVVQYSSWSDHYSYPDVRISTDAEHWQQFIYGSCKGAYIAGASLGRWMACGNGTFVTTGATSQDGVAWTPIMTSPNPTVGTASAAFGQGSFVAVGANGLIATSPDGRAWTNEVSGVTNNLVQTAYGDGQFLVVGANGVALTSSDHRTWTRRNVGTTKQLQAVAFGNGVFLVGGEEGLFRSGLIPPVTDTNRFRVAGCGLRLGGTMVLAAEGAPGSKVTVEASSDLANWIPLAAATIQNGEVEFSDPGARRLPKRFYRLAPSPAAPFEPPPGDPLDAWAKGKVLGLDVNYIVGLNQVVYGRGQFVTRLERRGLYSFCDMFEGADPTNLVCALAPVNASSGYPRSAAAANGRVFCWGVNDRGNYSVASTEDWTTWKTNAFAGINSYEAPADTLADIAHGNGKYLATLSKYILASTNGVDWTVTSSNAAPLLKIAFGEGRFVGLGLASNIVTSVDGVTWTESYRGDVALQAITHAFGCFVAVGSSGRLLRSEDGLAWFRQPVPTTVDLKAVTFGNGLLVAVGSSHMGGFYVPAVISSIDGRTWASHTLFSDADLADVAFWDGYFVTVGGMSFNGGGRTLRSGKVSSPVAVPEISGELSRRLEDGRMLLTVEGPAGRAVVVESCGNLAEWSEITVNPNDSGEFEAYDVSLDGVGPTHYRARFAQP